MVKRGTNLTATAGASHRPGGAARRRHGRAAARAARAIVGLAVTGGCYTYTPLVTPPEPGSRVEVTLSDRGRQATADSLGPSADRLEGTVRSRSDSALLVAIASVRYFTGQTTRWGGEPLNLNLSSVRSMRERRFSRSRTAMVAAAGVGALVAFIASRTLGTDEPQPTDSPPQTPGGPDQ